MSRTLDEVDVTIGTTLRQFRRQRRLSLEAVGQVIDVTYQQIQKYETGHNRLSARNLFVLARFFEVEVTAFYDGLEAATSAPEQELIAAQLARIKRDRPKVGKTLFDLVDALTSPDL